MRQHGPFGPALALILLGVFTSQSRTDEQVAPVVLHVAPTGKPGHPGTEKQPFATLEQARDEIRARKRKPGYRPGPIEVRIHDGTYRLTSPVVFTVEDSGSKDGPITYVAAPGARPRFSGGRQITGWTEATVESKKLWVADLPEVRAGKWYFRQLWITGQRATRARHPNTGVLRIAAIAPPKTKNPRYEGQDRFQYANTDMKRYANLTDVEVVALHLWVSVRLPVSEIDEKKREVRFSAKSLRRLVDGGPLARYYVENAFELLDSPGEWYLDRQKGKLYYWPRDGESREGIEAVAPHLNQLLRCEGKPQAKQYVEHLTLRGLTFEHAEWWLPRNLAGDEQACVRAQAVVEGDGVRHCTLDGCTIRHASGYGIHLARSCQNNRIVGCEVHDLGAGGVRIGETTQRTNPAEQSHNNHLTDSHIHHCGEIFHQAVGVWIGQSYNNRIAHNHIHDLLYTGISVGWTWGYGKTLARDNRIEFNHVHDIGKGLLSDMGGIYTLGMQPGTVIRHNIFHDIQAFRYGGWGIYFDEGSTNIVAENNLVYRTKHGGFHQHYGKENLVRNNIFALAQEAQLQRTRIEEHSSFTFERNIVYGEGEQFLAGRWEGKVVLDHNLYWRLGGGAIRFGKYTWDQWRKQGHDTHSLIADPHFVDPKKADFRLKSDSPAAKIGFKMPDLSTVGIRPPEKRGR